MRIREYTDADLAELVEMHRRQGFDYAFPDLDDPLFVSRIVLEDGEGKIVAAALAHLTSEIYFLQDPAAGSPRERWARVLALHAAGANDLRSKGLKDAHAWLPPNIARRFGRRLESIGWVRDDAWTPFCTRF
ncbi:MAG: hypothetical protein ACRD50_14145 [Candidatus Acidiferrales bacterium]